MTKVLIFDMDGVLFDTIPYAEEFYLKEHPGVTSEMYKEIHAGNYHEESEKYSHLVSGTDEEREERRTLYSEKKKTTPMFEGIEGLLKDLHNSGYTLVLNTGAFERNCLPLLEYSGIASLFDLIATAEVSKDKTEKFRLIEEKYKVHRDKMLFVTDALGDVKEAQTAKVPTVAVTWGVHDQTFFEREKYPNLIGIVNTVDELAEFIKS